jgi:RNA polymerase sigma-70 factor (ECF subfamily)
VGSVVNPTLTPEEKASILELRKSLRKCLDLIPQHYKEVLVLRYFRNKSYREISTILGISEKAVDGRLYRAKRRLAVVVVEEELDKFLR